MDSNTKITINNNNNNNNNSPTIYKKIGVLRRMYNWVLSWAHSKYSAIALFLLAFVESSFFPIPPDVLLIALGISKPKKAWFYALICTLGSVLGGLFGYFIGYALYQSIGIKIINFFSYESYFNQVGALYQGNAFLFVLGAAFTPIPYKVFTIAAGVWSIPISTLLIGSVIGRGARFFILSGLIYFFGPRIRKFIDKHFNKLTVIFFLILIAGFFIIKYLV